MQPQQITTEQIRAKFESLTPEQRTILAEKLELQLDNVNNSRQLAILSFQDGTDQFTAQAKGIQKQIDILNELINQ